MSGREAVGISGAASPARTVHVPGGQVLTERHHSAACIEGIAKGGSGRGSLRRSHTVTVWNVLSQPTKSSPFLALNGPNLEGTRAEHEWRGPEIFTHECEMRRTS